MKPGRNDPCYCGSGKKYKNCCSSKERNESPADVSWARVRRAIDGLPRQLARFVAEVYGPAAVETAWDAFTVWEGPAFDPESPLTAVFFPWLFHCWEPNPDDDTSVTDDSLHHRAPTRVLLERRAGRLDALGARYLAACLEAPFSLHEILHCDRGHGFRTRCVLTGREHDVLERRASETMQVGDILFAQLVPILDIVLLEACSPYVLPPIDKIRVVELREHIDERERSHPHSEDRRRAWHIEIRELYLSLIDKYIHPRRPVLHNTDGELLKLQSVIFDIDDAERALAALAQAVPGAEEPEVERAQAGGIERATFAWIARGNRRHASAERTVLGTVEIAGTRLVAHVNSDERAQVFRDIVARTLGDAARYSATELAAGLDSLGGDAAAALEQAMRGGGDAPLELSSVPEVRARVSRMLERHYADWPTTELPALGGRRPLDVVAEPNGREKVDALLTHMERHAEAQNDALAKAALARLRERLGLGK